MNKTIKKSKWIHFLISLTAITIPVASGALLVVACSNTDEQVQKQKKEMNDFAANIQTNVKNDSYSANVISTIINGDSFDVFNNEFIEFTFPENKENFSFEVQATLSSSGYVKVFITITHKQNTAVTTHVTFEYKEFPQTDSPQDKEFMTLYDIMTNVKLIKKPGNLRVVDAIAKINAPSFTPYTNDVFAVEISEKLQTSLGDFTPSAVAMTSPNSNTSVNVEFTLTSKTFADVKRTNSFMIDGFTYVSPVDLEREKLNQFANALLVTPVDKNQTLYDAVLKTNTAGFNVLSNDVFLLSDLTVAKDFHIVPVAVKDSLISMKLTLMITSRNYSEVSTSKTYTLSGYVDGRISETEKVNKLIADVSIVKRTDAVGKALTVDEAITAIEKQDTFDVYNNSVFTLSNVNELRNYKVSVTATKTSITSITVNLTITSKPYEDIKANKSVVLTNFIDPEVSETNKISALMNKISFTKKSQDFTQTAALTVINSDGFNLHDNTVFTLAYQSENIEPYTFSLTNSWKKDETMIVVTLKITSIKYNNITKSKDFIIDGFIDDDSTIDAQKVLLAEFMTNLNLVKKSGIDNLDADTAISTVNAAGFDLYHNNIFTTTPMYDDERFQITKIEASKASVTSIAIKITLTSILFPIEVTQTKSIILDNFYWEDPKENETNKLNQFMDNLAISKIASELTVPQAITAITSVDFNCLSNTVFTITPVDVAADFNLTASAVAVSTTIIDLTLTVTSKIYPELSQTKLQTLIGFIDPKAVEISKLQTLMDELTVTKKPSASSLTVVEALAALTAPDFNLFNNTVIIVSNETTVKAFNYTTSSVKVSDTEIRMFLTITSKTYADVTQTKTINLTGFDNSEILERNKLNTLMSVVTVSKTSTTLTANLALAEINKANFNIYSNSVFTLAPAVSAQEFDVSITNKVIQNTNDIKLTFKFASKTWPATVNATKDFTLVGFKTEAAVETEKMAALMAKISFTKKQSDITVDDAVMMINLIGFEIYSNIIFTIAPTKAEIEVYDVKLVATKTSDTDLSLSLTLTSKTIPSVKQTKAFSLTNFTPPLIEGVTGTGINKIYTDKKVGTVYVGTAENYTLGGKKFYGDPYTLNPFQDYGAKEMELLIADPTWPQIKQLIASSRPVSGTPNLDAYLPAVGTPITFTDAIKSNTNIPSNVKRFISIIDEPTYEQFFYYRNVVYSYREFLKAIAKYPRVLAEVNLDAAFIKNNTELQINGVLSPEKALAYVAKMEIATMFTHFMQETGAGLSALSNETLIRQTRPKQIPWNSSYDSNFTEPASMFTNNDLLSSALIYGITLANKTEMEANRSAPVPGTEKQALYYVSEAAFIDDTSLAARTAYTSYDLSPANAHKAAAFPVPLGADKISTVSYIGRGAKQLSWNYNYGPASRVFFGDDNADELLNNPSRVAKEGWLAIGTAIMFYMTPVGNKPSMHDAITGAWEPTTAQQNNFNWKPGLGLSINIINGGLELNADGNEANQKFQALNRQYYYVQNTKALGIFDFINSSYFDNAGYKQTLFSDAAGVASVNINWSVAWDGAPDASLVTWDTAAAFKVNFPGDYYRTWKAYQNSTFIADNGIIVTGDKAAIKSADWKAGKNPTYTKVGPNYDWKSK